jgi:hypothetical protein
MNEGFSFGCLKKTSLSWQNGTNPEYCNKFVFGFLESEGEDGWSMYCSEFQGEKGFLLLNDSRLSPGFRHVPRNIQDQLFKIKFDN